MLPSHSAACLVALRKDAKDADTKALVEHLTPLVGSLPDLLLNLNEVVDYLLTSLSSADQHHHYFAVCQSLAAVIKDCQLEIAPFLESILKSLRDVLCQARQKSSAPIFEGLRELVK